MTGPLYLNEVISFSASLFVALGIGFLFGFSASKMISCHRRNFIAFRWIMKFVIFADTHLALFFRTC